MRLKKIFYSKLILIFILCFESISGSQLENFPVKLIQPNGDTIDVFLSGDEYYNWVHDGDNYTIIQDQKTGYYVYADLLNGELIPTVFIVSRVDPASAGLKKNLNITPEKMLEYRNKFLMNSPPDMGRAPKTGIINNLIVFIRFSGESEFTDTKLIYENMFNNGTAGHNSMYNYFREVSYENLYITSTQYPETAGSTVISYQDVYTRTYYQPYNVTNTIGYKNDTERRDREHLLLANAINYISSQVPALLVIDGDNDGRVDNVCFIISGSPGAWADLLWPHRWSLYSRYVYINGKRVYDYNFQLQNSLASSGVGVLCHEMFHSLGAPDLYHYSYDGFTPVGAWDVMQSNRNPPQHMGAFMKYRYGTWISSIPVITSGTYTLNPITSVESNCFRINSPNSATDYFIVEYRRKTGTFEGSLPGTGLLVYRINTLKDGQGNANGPPDEVYIYRPGGSPTINGTINNANFSSTVGRTAINDTTDPYAFLTDGSPGGLNIHSISQSGETITFTLGALPDPVTDLTVLSPTSNSLTLQWTTPSGISGYDIRYSTSPINDTTAFNTALQLYFTDSVSTPGAQQSYLVEGLYFVTTYYFAIRTINNSGLKSFLSNSASGTTWNAPSISAQPQYILKTIQTSTIVTDTILITNTTPYLSTLDFTVTFSDVFMNGLIKAQLIPVSSENALNKPEEVITISRNIEWLAGSVSSGRIYNGNSINLILTINTENCPPGNYTAAVILSSNDPLHSSTSIPVVIKVRIPQQLTLSAIIEGLYNGTVMSPDTVIVELRNSLPPFTLVDQIKILLDLSGSGSGIFNEALSEVPYYLVVRHRSAIETWSAVTQTFSSNFLSYDFTSSSVSAYGSNLKQVGSKWCLYSGDVNRDGYVNYLDLNLVYIGNVLGAEGYLSGDLNGDGLIEIADLTTIYINKESGIQTIRPGGVIIINPNKNLIRK